MQQIAQNTPLPLRKWHRKAVKDGLKALLPFQPALRRFKRALVPYTTDASNDAGLFADGVNQIAVLHELGISIANARVVEIGTGWNPLLPLLFRLCGARDVVTVDQERLLDINTLRHALSFLSARKPEIDCLLTRLGRPQAFDLEAVSADTGASLQHALTFLKIRYFAPGDFTQLPAASADLIISRDVLEHIPEPILHRIMEASQRVLSPGGALCHLVDMSDHWEHEDKSISRINFLQYDGVMWKLAGLNPQNFQNRLRRGEYIAMCKQHGFEVLRATGTPDNACLGTLDKLALCSRYAGFPKDDLAVLSTLIVARKAK